jgi:hypothetical protein
MIKCPTLNSGIFIMKAFEFRDVYQEVNLIYKKHMLLAAYGKLQPITNDMQSVFDSLQGKLNILFSELNIKPEAHDWFYRYLFNNVLNNVYDELSKDDITLQKEYSFDVIDKILDEQIDKIKVMIDSNVEFKSQKLSHHELLAKTYFKQELIKVDNQILESSEKLFNYLLDEDRNSDNPLGSPLLSKVTSLFFDNQIHVELKKLIINLYKKQNVDLKKEFESVMENDKLRDSVLRADFYSKRGYLELFTSLVINQYRQSVVKCFEFVKQMDEEKRNELVKNYTPSLVKLEKQVEYDFNELNSLV